MPIRFFETPPYIHPSGRSYANLSFRNLYNLQGQGGLFVQYFISSELKKVKFNLPPLQEFLRELTSRELLKLVNGDKFFLTQDYLIVNNGLLDYSAFSLKNINLFLKRNGYTMEDIRLAKVCDYKTGDVCINRVKSSLISLFSETTYIIFIGAIFILFITAISLYNRIRKQSLEEERKKHALRVLTHELRTPIASLLLQVDALNTEEHDLSEDLVDRLLRIESDIYRLKYLAEKSQGYLQANSDQLIQFKNRKVESFDDFVKSVIEETFWEKDNLSLNLNVSSEIVLDSYWVQMCLSNLLTNAQKYGNGIIEIETYDDTKYVYVSVKDQGQISVKNLKELFSKLSTSSSQGLGIGLKIVHKTLNEMGGSLSLESNPTKFIMSIPRGMKES